MGLPNDANKDCKFYINEAAVEPAKVLHNVTVQKDGTWTVHVYGEKKGKRRRPRNVLKHLPVCISSIKVTEKLSVLDQKFRSL